MSNVKKALSNSLIFSPKNIYFGDNFRTILKRDKAQIRLCCRVLPCRSRKLAWPRSSGLLRPGLHRGAAAPSPVLSLREKLIPTPPAPSTGGREAQGLERPAGAGKAAVLLGCPDTPAPTSSSARLLHFSAPSYSPLSSPCREIFQPQAAPDKINK